MQCCAHVWYVMKKSKLIEMLNSIEGDPEIKLWNGYVGDYMDVGGLIQTDLVKMNLPYFMEMVRLEDCRDVEGDPKTHQLSSFDDEHSRACYKKYHNWEMNDYVTDEDIKAKRYKRKKIVILSAKLRGISTFDRIGGISY